ncbi:SAM-dependent methyltransferase [Nonomuraea sp. 10N515B]|uniref:SAM-dependent methyltransferase n=1 Tax=Nonomuraea sp. 10N515B TaxID=3457422 RepID=UPI003FCD1F74
MAQDMASPEARNSGKGGSAALDADLLGHRRPVGTVSNFVSGFMAVAQEINPNVPNPARMYDYWLGGKDHFPADREAADRASLLNPHAKACALANRAFLRRVVRYLAERGVRQFLDIGTGLPSQRALRELMSASSLALDSAGWSGQGSPGYGSG